MREPCCSPTFPRTSLFAGTGVCVRYGLREWPLPTPLWSESPAGRPGREVSAREGAGATDAELARKRIPHSCWIPERLASHSSGSEWTPSPLSLGGSCEDLNAARNHLWHVVGVCAFSSPLSSASPAQFGSPFGGRVRIHGAAVARVKRARMRRLYSGCAANLGPLFCILRATLFFGAVCSLPGLRFPSERGRIRASGMPADRVGVG